MTFKKTGSVKLLFRPHCSLCDQPGADMLLDDETGVAAFHRRCLDSRLEEIDKEGGESRLIISNYAPVSRKYRKYQQLALPLSED